MPYPHQGSNPFGGESRPGTSGGVQAQVRSLLDEFNGSSVYTESPDLSFTSPLPTSHEPTTRPSSMNFFRRLSRPFSSNRDAHVQLPDTDDLESGRRTRAPSQAAVEAPRLLFPQTNYSPATQPSEWNHPISGRHPADPLPDLPDRHPADPLPAMPQPTYRDGERGLSYIMPPQPALDPETEEMARILRPKKHKRRRRHHHHNAWVRRKGPHRGGKKSCIPLMNGPTRSKCICCFISAIFLATILAAYLSIALTAPDVGQEVHVLFILTIIGTTVFFLHSLIRLVMISMHPEHYRRQERRRNRNRIPSISGPQGFEPDVPIRVHLARDEEIVEEDEVPELTAEKMKVPPPAYGLWRGSVRINPHMLHWQRVDGPESPTDPNPNPNPNPINPSTRDDARAAASAALEGGISANVNGNTAPQHARSPISPLPPSTLAQPRPPSYASDDGVSYVVAAQPRSTVLLERATGNIVVPPQPQPQPTMTAMRPTSGVSGIHPAYRTREYEFRS